MVDASFPRKAPIAVGAAESGPEWDFLVTYCGPLFGSGTRFMQREPALASLKAVLEGAFERVYVGPVNSFPPEVSLYFTSYISNGGFQAELWDRSDPRGSFWWVTRRFPVLGYPCPVPTAEAYLSSRLQEGMTAFVEALKERQEMIAGYSAHKRRLSELVRSADAAAEAGDKGKAFAVYLEALRGLPYRAPEYQPILDKMMPFVPDADLPEIPESARRAVAIAQARFKATKDAGDLWNSIESFERAVELAPWWPALHFNMGVSYELAATKFHKGHAKTAVASYRRYLAASPDAKDAAEVRQRTYALEALAP